MTKYQLLDVLEEVNKYLKCVNNDTSVNGVPVSFVTAQLDSVIKQCVNSHTCDDEGV